MTLMDFVNGLNAFQINANAYAQASIANSAQYGISRLVGDRSAVTLFAVNADWAGLSAYCQTKLGGLALTFSSLAAEQSQVNALYAQLMPLGPEFSTHYLAPKNNASWVIRRAQLVIDLASAGMAPADVEVFLTKLDTKGGQNGFDYLKSALDQFPALISEAQRRHLSLFSYYYHTKAIADYNLIVGTPQAPTYNVSSKISSLLNSIKTRQTALYTKLNANDFNGLITTCNSGSTWIDTKMQAEVLPILAYCHQKRQAVGSSFTVDGRRAINAGNLLQQAVYSKALFAWVKWQAQWHPEVDSKAEMAGKASSLANTPIAMAGTIATVANLHTNPAAYDGIDVIVEGKISNLSITHVTATKVVSTADLSNINGTAIKVALAHIKLDSGGLVNNGYAKLSGTFRSVNAEAGNQPALSIGRYPFSTLSKTGWNAWLRRTLLSVYEPVAHNLEAIFSIEPSGDGAINPAKYGTTSAKANSISLTNKVY